MEARNPSPDKNELEGYSTSNIMHYETIDHEATLQNIVPIDSEKVVSTPEAPLYSPIIPDQQVYLAGEKKYSQTIVPIDSVEAISTPEAPIYSPITPIDRNVFLAGGKPYSQTIANIDSVEAVSTPEAPLYSPITTIRPKYLSSWM